MEKGYYYKTSSPVCTSSSFNSPLTLLIDYFGIVTRALHLLQNLPSFAIPHTLQPLREFAPSPTILLPQNSLHLLEPILTHTGCENTEEQDDEYREKYDVAALDGC